MGRIASALPRRNLRSKAWREFALIEWIINQVGKRPDTEILGLGDDASIHKPIKGQLELTTCDALIEGVHWERAWCSPQALGRKAAAVNLSDIAAMGGVPRRAHLILALPKALPYPWIHTLIKSLIIELKQYQVHLVGGDTVMSPGPVMIALTVQGTVFPQQVVRRQGARPGDVIMVTGNLGGAAVGLELLRHPRVQTPGGQFLKQRLLTPRPRLKAGQILAASGYVHAMMDISDGLSGDLRHLAQSSHVGACLYAAQLPIAIETQLAAKKLQMDVLPLALSGGEDYELLFTCAPQHTQCLQKQLKQQANLPGTVIGAIEPKRKGLKVILPQGLCQDLPPGWEHG